MIVSIKSYRWVSKPEANVSASIGHDVNAIELVRPLAKPVGKSGAFWVDMRVYRLWEMHPQTLRWQGVPQPQWPS